MSGSRRKFPDELAETVLWYEARRQGLGSELLDEVQATPRSSEGALVPFLGFKTRLAWRAAEQDKETCVKKKRIVDGLRAWIDARKRHHLSHAQVQMARELGMNPRRLGALDNHARSVGSSRCRSSSKSYTGNGSDARGPNSSCR